MLAVGGALAVIIAGLVLAEVMLGIVWGYSPAQILKLLFSRFGGNE